MRRMARSEAPIIIVLDRLVLLLMLAIQGEVSGDDDARLRLSWP